ncbi:hypothetical protein Trydic_g13730 [Trypoxylus dichotomus]
MGPTSGFGKEHENHLSRHILTIPRRGFPLIRGSLRSIAHNFDQQLKIKHKFNNKMNKAGCDRLSLFLNRHWKISICKQKDVLTARAKVINRKEVEDYFTVLGTTMEKKPLFDKPQKLLIGSNVSAVCSGCTKVARLTTTSAKVRKTRP